MHKPAQKQGEFIALIAFLMSIVALSIDAILPALHSIGNDFKISDENDLQWIIGSLFIGMTIGQLIYGPLSDSIGRKKTIYIGLVIYLIGSFLAIIAQDFNVLLFGRFLQGFGAASPRVLTIAMVRDRFSGREMAKVMSFVMTIFILVPAIAPSLGAGILFFGHWEVIFYVFIGLGIVNFIWLITRQEETLHPDHVRPFNLFLIFKAILEVLKNPISLGYMFVASMGFSILVAYLNTSKLFYYDVFNVDDLFPVYFGLLALMIGGASLVNGRLVPKYGMQVMMRTSLIVICCVTALFLMFLLFVAETPPFVLFLIVMAVTFFFMGIIFGNSNALAMEPLGHMAGLASSVIGSGTSLLSLTFGSIIGQLYDHTLIPIIAGYVLLSFCGIGVMTWTEHQRKKLA